MENILDEIRNTMNTLLEEQEKQNKEINDGLKMAAADIDKAEQAIIDAQHDHNPVAYNRAAQELEQAYNTRDMYTKEARESQKRMVIPEEEAEATADRIVDYVGILKMEFFKQAENIVEQLDALANDYYAKNNDACSLLAAWNTDIYKKHKGEMSGIGVYDGVEIIRKFLDRWNDYPKPFSRKNEKPFVD